MSDINEIGATAFVIASIRSMEAEHSPPLFSAPYAEWFSNEPALAAARQLDAAFPPSTTMVRFRTRFFNGFIESGIEAGARQVILLGGGFDMRAHHYGDTGAAFFEVDQKAVLDFKGAVLGRHGIEPPPSLPGNYLEVDVPGGLAGAGFDPAAPTLIVWEGNTMYLPPETILPFPQPAGRRHLLLPHRLRLLRRRPAEPRLRHRGGPAQARGRGEGDGRLLPHRVPRPRSLREGDALSVAESGTFADLGEEYGLGAMVAAYPEDWRETLKLYRYCVLAKG